MSWDNEIVNLSNEELSKRRELCQAEVTLDGKRASIRGVRLKFATVAAYGSGVSGEWSWVAVERIVAAGGNFRL